MHKKVYYILSLGMLVGVIVFAVVKNKPGTPAPSPAPETKETTFTTDRFNFSLYVPKETEFGYGACEWKEAEKSYRPKAASVPVKIFEDSTTTYISVSYYYHLKGATKKDNISYFSGCDKVDTTFALLRDPNDPYIEGWAIKTATVADLAALNNFIRVNYGQSCSAGEQTPTAQDGVFDVAIKGDGKDLEQTGCPINFMIALKYYPERQRVATWSMGQSCYFPGPSTDQVFECFDQDMAKSFRFN